MDGECYWLVPEYATGEARYVTELRRIGANLLFFRFDRQNLPGNIWRLSRLFSRHRIDVAYTHFGSKRFLVEAAAKLSKVAVARGEHNLAFRKDRRFRMLKRLFWIWSTDYFVPVSRAIATHLVENKIMAGNFRVVHDGFDLEKFPEPDPEISRKLLCDELQLGSATRFLVCVAKIHPAKGQRLLVDVLKALPEMEVALLLVGSIADMEYADEIMTYAREAGVHERMKMLGYRTDIPRILDAADISYLPSLVEGLGNVVIESGLMATPVIASDLPAIREIIEDQDDGYLVASSNAEDYVRLTRLLLESETLRLKVGAKAREKMRNQFSREIFVENTLRALSECEQFRSRAG